MPEEYLSRRHLLIKGIQYGGGALALAASGYVGYRWRGDEPASATNVAASSSALNDSSAPYVSRPDLSPPLVRVSREEGWTASSTLDGSYYLLTPKKYADDAIGQAGLMILDKDGALVWFLPSTDRLTTVDLQVQTYRGEPVLTWWKGKATGGFGEGEGYIANAAYESIATIRAGNGLKADSHELNLTPSGSALITTYRKGRADLTSLGGPRDGVVYACQAQEIDVATGKLLFAWDSLDHVGVGESYATFKGGTAASPYDYFHMNSVSLAADGDLLISSRNTWTIYKVSRSSGEIVWRLNGKKSDFAMARGTTFEWQHHARALSGNSMSIFDDAASPTEEPQSRGLILDVDESAMRCTLVRQYVHPAKLLAANQGSIQVLEDGRVLVGWGDLPYFSEFLASGDLVVDGRFPADVQSYRAFRSSWVGHPSTKPDVAVKLNTSANTVYVSWNGDTRTATWRILAGTNSSQLVETASAARTGFETVVSVQSSGPYFAVVALDQNGAVLAQSDVVKV